MTRLSPIDMPTANSITIMLPATTKRIEERLENVMRAAFQRCKQDGIPTPHTYVPIAPFGMGNRASGATLYWLSWPPTHLFLGLWSHATGSTEVTFQIGDHLERRPFCEMVFHFLREDFHSAPPLDLAASTGYSHPRLPTPEIKIEASSSRGRRGRSLFFPDYLTLFPQTYRELWATQGSRPTNAELAERLAISPETVDDYVRRIRQKFQPWPPEYPAP